MSGGSQFFYVDMSKYRSFLDYCEIRRAPLNFNDYQHTRSYDLVQKWTNAIVGLKLVGKELSKKMGNISLRNLRIQAGKTQAETAEVLDVSTSTYKRWEKNPLEMPHGMWLETVQYLEMSAQIRKKTKMATDYGHSEVVFDEPMTDEEEERNRASYTVPIPDSLTNSFEPSQPITDKQFLDWEIRHIEPYPGYAEEYAAWQDAWEEIDRAQAEADGNPYNYVDNMKLQPEFDPQTGEPIDYEEPVIFQNAETNKVEVHLPDEDAVKADAEARGEDTSITGDEEE